MVDGISGAPGYIGPVTPARPWQYGLQSQASVMTGDTRWAYGGIIHDVDDCDPAQCWSHECPDPNEPKDTDQPEQDTIVASPVTVYAISPPCMGGDAMDRAQARARARLVAGEWAAVERAVFGLCGGLPDSPWGDAELPAGTATVGMEQALAAIEYGMRNYGGAGIIHAPRQTYGYWGYGQHIIRNGPRLETEVGTGWAFGRGYLDLAAPGEPQTDELIDPTDVWIYGSGAVRIWRSPITTPGDRETTYDYRANASRAIAERTYTVSIQCPIVAVHVDLTACS